MRRAFVAPDWSERLAQAGLPDLTSLLERGRPMSQRPGTWHALTKPGLGGRERWRWELAGAGGDVLYLKR